MAIATSPGKIKDFSVNRYGCEFRLTSGPQPANDGRFMLPVDTQNYASKFAILLAASVHGFPVEIGTASGDDIEIHPSPEVFQITKA